MLNPIPDLYEPTQVYESTNVLRNLHEVNVNDDSQLLNSECSDLLTCETLDSLLNSQIDTTFEISPMKDRVDSIDINRLN